MIVDDSEVEIKKFKMFAEKLETESQIIDLCKKYLKHKGVDVDNTAALSEIFRPKEPEKIYVGMSDIVKVQGRFKLNEYDFRDTQHKLDSIAYASKYVVDEITHQLVKENMIEFETYKDPACYQTIICGNLNVYRKTK